MRGLDEFTQLRLRAEVFLDSVKILRVVTVKSGARFVFLQFDFVEAIVVVVPRCKPDGGDAEILLIREVIDHALKITAVVIKLVLAIVEAT